MLASAWIKIFSGRRLINSEITWMQHFIHHLSPTGIAGFVLANGSMSSNTSGEGEIRKNIVEADLVDCMVALPSQLFYNTMIPACLWFVARDKKNHKFRDRRGEVLFIDARKMGVLVDRRHRELTDDEVQKIASTYHAWRGEGGKYEDVAGFCSAVKLDEIKTHRHILTPGRYVGAEEVEDDGEPFEEKIICDVSKRIADNIEPKIYPKIKKTNLDGADCIHIEFQGNNSPYYAYGRAYIRVGDEDRQLSAKELENLILRKNKDKLRWDTAICEEAKLTDISSTKLKGFLKITGLKYDTVNNTLKKLTLLSDGKLLNAAVILFGKKPHSFFPNAKLRCAVFGTTDTSFTIDMKDFDGDLFYLIERAEEYVLKNIHIGMKLEGLRRVDVPEIDKEAFREAKITTKELADKTGLSVKGIEWNIKELKDKGLLRRIGADRGGYWEVVGG